MAPIKFEEQLKDKLEKRTLSPSPESWSKLSDRIEAQENKSKNPIFRWLSIAAGLIIMIAVSAHFFISIDSENTAPEMVEEDSKMEQLEDKKSKLDDTKSLQIAIEDQKDTETKDSTIIKEPQIIDNS